MLGNTVSVTAHLQYRRVFRHQIENCIHKNHIYTCTSLTNPLIPCSGSRHFPEGRAPTPEVGAPTYYNRLQTKFRKGNVFTPVCQSFCSQGGLSASVHAGIHTAPGRPPWADTPLGRHPSLADPPLQTATAADGTHPTEMHSCFAKCLPKTARK